MTIRSGNRKTGMWIAVCAIAVGFVVILTVQRPDRIASGSQDRGETDDPQVVRPVDDDSGSKPGSDGSSRRPVSPPMGQATPSTADDPVAIAALAKTATEALDTLIPAFQAGNVRAALAIIDLISRCSAYRDGQDFWPLPSAPEGSAAWSAQRDAILRLGTFCGTDPRLQNQLGRAINVLRQQIYAKARSGDLEALSYALGQGVLGGAIESEEVAALALLRSDTSAAAKASTLRKLITGRIQSQFSDFGSDVLDRAPLIPPDRQRFIKEMAVEVYGCRNGIDCRAFGVEQDQHCVAFGDCAANLPWDQFVLTRLLTPHEASMVLELADRLQTFPPRG